MKKEVTKVPYERSFIVSRFVVAKPSFLLRNEESTVIRLLDPEILSVLMGNTCNRAHLDLLGTIEKGKTEN